MALDFEDLNAFVHVARHGSFSKAASHMRVAQSALSRRVGRLEHTFGLPLLARHARGTRPTEAGTILLGRAEELMRSLESIERDLLSLSREPTGHLQIAFPPTAGQVLAPLLVSACRRRFPGITMDLREGFSGTIHEWLIGGAVDLALLYHPEPNSELVIEPILDEPLYLIAPTTSARSAELEAMLVPDKSGTKVFDTLRLGELPLVLPERSHSIRLMLERFASNRGIQLDVTNVVSGTRLIRALVEADLGYSVFSYAGVYENLVAGTLKTIPLSPALDWQLSMAHRKSASSSIVLSAIRSLILEEIHLFMENGYWHGRLTGLRNARTPERKAAGPTLV